MKENRFLLIGMTVLLAFALIFSLAGCPNGNDPDPNPNPSPNPDPNNPSGGGGAKTGLYVGIIGFNENVTTRQIGLLDTGNKTQFQTFIDNLTMQPATGLYYAVDNAIDKLQTATLPDDLVNVSIVTFTDGLDNASTAINSNYNSRDAYRDAVSARLASTKINNLNISAYSIGIKGGDVVDGAAFSAGLTALASDALNVFEVTDMTLVEKAFVDIADSLYQESKSQSIRLRLSGGYDDGNKIRFTFDNVTDAANSNFYIEGIFTRSGNARSLQNIVYQGLTSSSGTTVSGDISGVYVYFTFENTKTTSGDDVNTTNVKQWAYIESENRWQPNSEFGGVGDIEPIVTETSAVIMLVLDCTTSLNAGGATGFADMKRVAKRFIDVLVDGLTQSTYTVTFNANGGSGSVQSMTANSGASITLPSGSGLSRSGYTFGGWNTSAAGTGTNYNAGASYTVNGNVTLYAKWDASGGTDPTTYTVTFNANGGSGSVQSMTANSGASITLPSGSGLSRSGYTFSGWNTSSAGTGTNYNAGASYTVNSNVTLYAKWDTSGGPDPTTYTVTFNANGGSGSVSSQTANSGSSITLPSGGGLSRSGYTFGGWNTSSAGTGTNYSAGSSYTVNGNVTLYAKWDAASSGTTSITLAYNPYWQEGSYWQYVYQADSLLNGGRIVAGDVYTLSYSFTSNVWIDRLQVTLADTSPAAEYWAELSNYPWIQENISANTVVSGSVTFIVTATATDATDIANCLVVQAGQGTPSAPTLTFTALSLESK